MNCPLCDCKENKEIVKMDGGYNNIKVICQECGHIFANPPISDENAEKFYREEYNTKYRQDKAFAKENTETRVAWEIYHTRNQYDWLCSQLPIGHGLRVLDVGCGYGSFLAHMSEHGCDVMGIEPNLKCEEMFRELYGFKLFRGMLHELNDDIGKFDLIILSACLEHVSNPVTFIENALNFLDEHGYIYISVPNGMMPPTRPLSPFAPSHFSVFTIATIVRLLKKLGLVTTAINTAYHNGAICLVARRGDASNIELQKQAQANVLAILNIHEVLYDLLKDPKAAVGKIKENNYLDKLKQYEDFLRYLIALGSNDKDEVMREMQMVIDLKTTKARSKEPNGMTLADAYLDYGMTLASNGNVLGAIEQCKLAEQAYPSLVNAGFVSRIRGEVNLHENLQLQAKKYLRLYPFVFKLAMGCSNVALVSECTRRARILGMGLGVNYGKKQDGE